MLNGQTRPERPKGRGRLIVAADVPGLDEARRLLDQLGDRVDWFKVGLELFTAAGPAAVDLFVQARKRVFLDLKFHDIPNTVAGAARSAARLGVAMFNVHAHGGLAMARAAAEAAAGAAGGRARPIILGVTVLTSLDEETLSGQLGVARPIDQQVLAMADLANAAGVDGVVASPREVQPIKARLGRQFLVVTPGVRPAGIGGGDDQRRVMTPGQAVAAGSDYVVVGRPITRAADPKAAAAGVIEEIEASEEAAGRVRP